MDPVFQRAFIPPRPRILCRPLLPLSLAHLALLDIVDSPFVRGGPAAEVTPGDLAVAVWICSQCGSELRDSSALEQPSFREAVRWGLECRGENWTSEKAAFETYLEDSLTAPEVWRDGDSKPLSADWKFSVVAALIEMGIDRAEAWDMPVSEALSLYIANQERHGLDVMSEDERAAVGALEERP